MSDAGQIGCDDAMKRMSRKPDIRIGDWIQTSTGRAFWPLDPRANEIDIIDIAHSLSMKCRYGGHCARFYSVAEHSVIVSYYVPRQYALWGLLHDAAEAYLADVPRPVKPSLQGWAEIELRVMQQVAARFNLTPLIEPPEVKSIDWRICADEKQALMIDGPAWTRVGEPLGAGIACLPPEAAKGLFLRRFTELNMLKAA